MAAMSSPEAAAALPTAPLRQDAGVIGLVGAAHLVSHFTQLLLAPLFPWLKEAFDASYVELGFLMTLFFVVSCAVQAASGFLVDRYGPHQILFGGLVLLAVATFGFASSTGYWMLAFFVVVAGLGNGVFHPVDYTLLNRKVSVSRLGHAYSVHGLTGSLGWALAPALVVPLALAFSWRVALAAAGAVVLLVLGVVWSWRRRLDLPPPTAAAHAHAAQDDGRFGFLRIPAVWMCFAFFLLYAGALSVVQAFAPEAARLMHGVPVGLAAACLTVYMVCAAAGIAFGGFLASDPARCERVVGFGFGAAALFALAVATLPLPAAAVPVLFGAMGLVSGIAGPSRDMIVKQSTPAHASGRVYGVVYSGLDIGQAIAPLVFGALMDRGSYRGVWLGLVLVQALMIGTALNVRKARRTVLAAA